MSKSLIIAIIASLVPTLVNAKSYMQRRTKAQPRSQIASTVVGCIPVPVGCVPRPGRTWSGLPSGFDVIVCPPGARQCARRQHAGDDIPLVTAFACRRAILSMSKASAHIHDAARTLQL